LLISQAQRTKQHDKINNNRTTTTTNGFCLISIFSGDYYSSIGLVLKRLARKILEDSQDFTDRLPFLSPTNSVKATNEQKYVKNKWTS